MKSYLISFAVAYLLGLVHSLDEQTQEYLDEKREDLAENTCYIYGDFSVFDLRSLAARSQESPD